jgi:hypothetical protein
MCAWVRTPFLARTARILWCLLARMPEWSKGVDLRIVFAFFQAILLCNKRLQTFGHEPFRSFVPVTYLFLFTCSRDVESLDPFSHNSYANTLSRLGQLKRLEFICPRRQNRSMAARDAKYFSSQKRGA